MSVNGKTAYEEQRTEQQYPREWQEGVKAAFYHAGMKTKERKQAGEEFMNDFVGVIVAISAFGMGIDNSRDPVATAITVKLALP